MYVVHTSPACTYKQTQTRIQGSMELECVRCCGLTTSLFNILQSLMILRAPITFICRASLLERKERRRRRRKLELVFVSDVYSVTSAVQEAE